MMAPCAEQRRILHRVEELDAVDAGALRSECVQRLDPARAEQPLDRIQRLVAGDDQAELEREIVARPAALDAGRERKQTVEVAADLDSLDARRLRQRIDDRARRCLDAHRHASAVEFDRIGRQAAVFEQLPIGGILQWQRDRAGEEQGFEVVHGSIRLQRSDVYTLQVACRFALRHASIGQILHGCAPPAAVEPLRALNLRPSG